MSQAGSDSLGAEEVARLRAAVAHGERPTVYFTAAAVGVDATRSGKVVTVGDAPEGDFIQVKPAGQSDVLSFSPGELALSKPRKDPTQAVGCGRAGGKQATKTRAGDPQRKSQAAAGAGEGSPQQTSSGAPPRDARGPRTAAAPAKVTITIASDDQGGWRVDVLAGRRKPVRSLQVSAGSVAKAASALAPAVAEAIDTALAAARERQRARVEQLREELATAQRTLDELG